MQWEYYTLVLGAQMPGLFQPGGMVDPAEFDHEMNRLGRHGWEMVGGFPIAMAHGGTRDVVLIFKRPRVATAVAADK
ncbi:MAG TPA: DUF4177 domain-containing protein [Gemmataceae bacterium]|jgi:hypothetical protein|nr:DUF4177 domain-containing protein [Gemmataceae bacterium]